MREEITKTLQFRAISTHKQLGYRNEKIQREYNEQGEVGGDGGQKTLQQAGMKPLLWQMPSAHSVSSIQQVGREKGRSISVHLHVHAQQGAAQKSHALPHSADAQNRGDALAEHSRRRQHWLLVEAARQHEGHRTFLVTTAGSKHKHQRHAESQKLNLLEILNQNLP